MIHLERCCVKIVYSVHLLLRQNNTTFKENIQEKNMKIFTLLFYGIIEIHGVKIFGAYKGLHEENIENIIKSQRC
jgi:hypothetical protein